MPKIKEIKKIESPIKEIKKVKVESIDDEFEEYSDTESSADNLGVVRRFNKTSTLAASEAPQETVRERRIAKEDEEEIRFRPSYTAGANESKSAYTPVGAAESSAVSKTRVLGEDRPLERRNDLQQQNPNNEQRGGEMGGGRNYIEDNDKKRDRRRDM